MEAEQDTVLAMFNIPDIEKIKERYPVLKTKIEELLAGFRSRQTKSDVQTCAKKLVRINEKKKLKVRYTIGVSWIYRVFTKMPDGLKEWAIRRFN